MMKAFNAVIAIVALLYVGSWAYYYAENILRPPTSYDDFGHFQVSGLSTPQWAFLDCGKHGEVLPGNNIDPDMEKMWACKPPATLYLSAGYWTTAQERP